MKLTPCLEKAAKKKTFVQKKRTKNVDEIDTLFGVLQERKPRK